MLGVYGSDDNGYAGCKVMSECETEEEEHESVEEEDADLPGRKRMAARAAEDI